MPIELPSSHLDSFSLSAFFPNLSFNRNHMLNVTIQYLSSLSRVICTPSIRQEAIGLISPMASTVALLTLRERPD